MRNVCANSLLYKSSNENNDLIGNRYYYKYTRAGYTHDICKFTFTKSYRTIRSKLQIYIPSTRVRIRNIHIQICFFTR